MCFVCNWNDSRCNNNSVNTLLFEWIYHDFSVVKILKWFVFLVQKWYDKVNIQHSWIVSNCNGCLSVQLRCQCKRMKIHEVLLISICLKQTKCSTFKCLFGGHLMKWFIFKLYLNCNFRPKIANCVFRFIIVDSVYHCRFVEPLFRCPTKNQCQTSLQFVVIALNWIGGSNNSIKWCGAYGYYCKC